MENVWAWVSAVLAGIVLIGNAADKIGKAWKAVKAPENSQNDRLDKVEEDVRIIKEKLDRDNHRLDDTANANHVTQEALLALLEHGLHGNNIEQMTKAKQNLEKYLINH